GENKLHGGARRILEKKKMHGGARRSLEKKKMHGDSRRFFERFKKNSVILSVISVFLRVTKLCVSQCNLCVLRVTTLCVLRVTKLCALRVTKLCVSQCNLCVLCVTNSYPFSRSAIALPSCRQASYLSAFKACFSSTDSPTTSHFTDS